MKIILLGCYFIVRLPKIVDGKFLFSNYIFLDIFGILKGKNEFILDL